MLSNSPPIKEPHKSAEMDDQRLHPACLNDKTGSRAYIYATSTWVILVLRLLLLAHYVHHIITFVFSAIPLPIIPFTAPAPLRSLSHLIIRSLHTSSSMVVTPTRPPVEPTGPPLSPLALASTVLASSSDSYSSSQSGSRSLQRHRRTSGSSFSKLSEFSLDPPLLDKKDQYAASPDQIDENGVNDVRHVALSVDAR